jgi:hypothetical protein
VAFFGRARTEKCHAAAAERAARAACFAHMTWLTKSRPPTLRAADLPAEAPEELWRKATQYFRVAEATLDPATAAAIRALAAAYSARAEEVEATAVQRKEKAPA